MIRSMTGYGRAEVPAGHLMLSAEVKSLNHRHLDIAVRLPRALSAFEPEARRLVHGTLARGRVEVVLALGGAEGTEATSVGVNLDQAREYQAAALRLADTLGYGSAPGVDWLLAQPGVLERGERPALDPGAGQALMGQVLGQALADLVARREAEGKALGQELGRLHEALVSQVDDMARLAPAASARKAARLRERVAALLATVPVDEGRLATEIAVLAERSDVTEELARLRAHLEQMALLLGEGGPVGRTLDFLIQEMNREGAGAKC
jgi:uncharacterized protein (TIGR00255 family)